MSEEQSDARWWIDHIRATHVAKNYPGRCPECNYVRLPCDWLEVADVLEVLERQRDDALAPEAAGERVRALEEAVIAAKKALECYQETEEDYCGWEDVKVEATDGIRWVKQVTEPCGECARCLGKQALAKLRALAGEGSGDAGQV